MNRTRAVVISATLITTLWAVPTTGFGGTTTRAVDDSYRVSATKPTRIRTSQGVLANDKPKYAQLVDHTDPSQGSLELFTKGGFRYTPDSGASGTDSFSYTTNSAVRLYPETIKPLATIGGVTIGGSAYGSAIAAKPGSKTVFYGLTDRGPNVDGPNDTKIEPLPNFRPAIGKFVLKNGKAVLKQRIRLRAADGTLMNGQVNSVASTGETITDLAGKVLPTSPYGIDPEGLVVLRDGTFWVSDEYGPFLIHFNRKGREIERLSPQSGTLPSELANRTVNRGMEGLTVTPNGKLLVGIMQSALDQRDASKPKANPLTRIVTVNLKTKAVHEYPYLLDDPGTNGTANSEITALSNSTFLVAERDGEFEPNAYKRLYTVKLAGATNIGPASKIAGTAWDDSLGLTVGGLSLEALTTKQTTSEATSTLAGVGITPVTKTLKLDLGAYLTSLNSKGHFFGHDKIEGLALVNKGRTLLIANDSDFGISEVTGDTAPFTLLEKTQPDDTQDDGEILAIDLKRVGVASKTAKVTLKLR